MLHYNLGLFYILFIYIRINQWPIFLKHSSLVMGLLQVMGYDIV